MSRTGEHICKVLKRLDKISYRCRFTKYNSICEVSSTYFQRFTVRTRILLKLVFLFATHGPYKIENVNLLIYS